MGQGHQNIINSLDCPKGIAVLVWSQGFKIKTYINLSEFSSYLSPPVIAKVTEIQSIFKLVSMIYQCKFGIIPTIGSGDTLHTRNCHAEADAV